MFSAEELLLQLNKLPAAESYLVAYSGGVDSTVLLHALASLQDRFTAKLKAVHINHGLQPEADNWAEHCADFCTEYGIEYHIFEVEVDRNISSLEAAAREARYAAFSRLMEKGDILFSAHHLNDQAETMLLNMMRGSGLHGLAGMPRLRKFSLGLLFRPLLSNSRADLEAYAEQHGLLWVEDPTNAGTDFDRNYLRHNVLPMLEERWPAAIARIANSAALAGEAASLLDDEATTRLKPMIVSAGRINLTKLMQQPPKWHIPLLRHWLLLSKAPPLPGRQIIEFIRQLGAAPDKQPAVEWHGWHLRRFSNVLYLGRQLQEIDPNYVETWDGNAPLKLPGNLGRLRLREGMGLDLKVRFRREGDVMRFHGQQKTLKPIMHDLAIPPWLRGHIPLVICNHRVVSIADREYADDAPVRLVWEGFPEDFLP